MEIGNAVVAREAKRVTRAQALAKALAGAITWQQAAQICGITARTARS
jgi:hypothetical protein